MNRNYSQSSIPFHEKLKFFFLFAFHIWNFMFYKINRFSKNKNSIKILLRNKDTEMCGNWLYYFYFWLSFLNAVFYSFENCPDPSSYFANDALFYKRATPSLHIYDKYPWFWGHLFDPFWVSSQIHKIAGFRMNQRHYRKKRIVGIVYL